MDKDGEIEVAVDVTNTGDRAGEEIIQLYIRYIGSKVDRFKKELKGFGRLALNPGETGTLKMKMQAKDLAYYDVESKEWIVEPIEYEVLVGGSSRAEDLYLKGRFKVKS